MQNIIWACVGVLAVASYSQAQIPNALDITAEVSLVDADGAVLSGNNPLSGSGHVPGCLVQLIHAGSDGKANLPQAGGALGGDDSLVAVSYVGEGMLAVSSRPGRFTFSVVPAPAKGTRVYVRIFNHRQASLATNWGQSALFTVSGARVLKVGALGLNRTAVPVGSDPATTDSDGDGVSDLNELVANTNARNRQESFSLPGLDADGSVTLKGAAGRNYRLWRATDLKSSDWVVVGESGVLAADQTITLRDANGPAARSYYRLTVTFPDLD